MRRGARWPGAALAGLAIAISSLLLAPSRSAAVGAEDTRFLGRTQAGGLVRLDFLTDPESWAGDGLFYGSPTLAVLSFCAVVPGAGPGDELHCGSGRGQPAGVRYRAVATGDDAPAFDADTPEGAAYRSIAREAELGTGDHPGDATLVRIFECAQGCTEAVPRQLFEVAFYD